MVRSAAGKSAAGERAVCVRPATMQGAQRECGPAAAAHQCSPVGMRPIFVSSRRSVQQSVPIGASGPLLLQGEKRAHAAARSPWSDGRRQRERTGSAAPAHCSCLGEETCCGRMSGGEGLWSGRGRAPVSR